MGGRGGGSGRGGGATGGGSSSSMDQLARKNAAIDNAKFQTNDWGLTYGAVPGVGRIEMQKSSDGYDCAVFNEQGQVVFGGGYRFDDLADAKSFGKQGLKRLAVQSAFKGSIGKTVSNNGTALGKVIGADAGSVRRTGNFQFSATVNGVKVRISTSPTDFSAGKIKINGIYEG